MRKKPLIGMNADFRGAKKDGPAFTYLATGYHNSIMAAGGIPVIVPILENESDLEVLLDSLDGFLLVGGADLDPRNDGFMLHSSMKLLDPKREQFDRQLARAIGRRRLPVFGIGAGMQLLNVSQGGNLYLHIPEDVPHALPHRDPIDPAHRHTLQVAADSLMGRVFGDGEIRVNSNHHMAVDEIAHGFRVTAKCPDGIIEAIESVREDWFAFGTQFHPESETATAIDIRIFQEFICGITGEVLPVDEELLAA